MPRTISDNKFKLGLFCSNCSGGITKTLATERWDSSYENNRKLALAAEAAGLDFMLPLANWLGLGGDAPTETHVLEPLVWAAGLLEATSKITIFSTIHTPFLHPVFATKQINLCDQIGRGRFGVNIVSGSNPAEFALFGIPLNDHDQRYALTEEWLTLVQRMWSEREPFDFKGRFFDLKGVVSNPGPYGGEPPLLISAGSSPTGREFAKRHADCLFMLIVSLDQLADEIRAIRHGVDRPFGVYASGHLFCRKTRKETEEFYHYIVHEQGDWKAADFLDHMHQYSGSIPAEVRAGMRERFVSGTGTFLVKGDPDDVAMAYKRMSDAGLDGMATALVNFLDELPILRDEVLPRMERLGLRRSVAAF
ncbi:MAG: LLM class flavin-dependent oxidoreductase [Candidatus Binataceae bacterium]|nr:LLM class flavin-dependent oxidoreductase [Candidatus Binataceae bacterium]